jgi:hypothetical protein
VVLPGTVATRPRPGGAGAAAAGPAGDGPAPRPGTRRGRSGGAGRAKPPAGPRPWWRRRRFWQAVLAVEVVAALAVSVVLAEDPDAFSLDGMDQERFCADVRRFRDEGTYEPALTLDNAAGLLGRQARAYRDLAGTGPTDVRRDFEALGAVSERMAAIAADLQARHQREPGFAAAVELADRQATMAAESQLAARRVESAVRQACGIDVTAEAPSTTTPPAPSTVAPGVPADPATTGVPADPATTGVPAS